MSILSWLGIKQRFMRRSALDEFEEFVKEEKARLSHADTEFDEEQFDKAVDLVKRRLQKRGQQS
jgi:DNA-binding MurR/RpiR family transcriptional regulator